MTTFNDERQIMIHRKQVEPRALCTAKFTPPELDDEQRRGLDDGMLQLISDIREIEAAAP